MSTVPVQKKVKFDEKEHLKEVIDYDEDSNDLDLDTIKDFRRQRGDSKNDLKEFDSEGESEGSALDSDAEKLNFDSDDGLSDEPLEEEEDEEEVEEQVQFEPFNLRQDREEGNFDNEGFYVRKRDEEASQDRWMANFTKSDMINARKAHEKQLHLQKQKQEPLKELSEAELYQELADLIPVESENLSILQVIRSLKGYDLGQSINKPRPPLNKNRLKKLQSAQMTDALPLKETPLITEAAMKKLEKITELADALMDCGNFGIYEETRREILGKAKR